MMADTTRFQRTATGDEAHQPEDADFPIVLRGYDRATVDEYVADMTRLVRDLEATQLRENVVQRALDEVGEQTASILQRAHETAEEITARSRAKAEGRLQRAEREAEIVRRDADEYAERIVADTRLLWDERQRLIEEMRQLADEVLGTADDASERLSQPEMIRPAEEAESSDATVQLQAVSPLAEEELAADATFADEPEAGAAPQDPPTAEFELPTADDDALPDEAQGGDADGNGRSSSA